MTIGWIIWGILLVVTLGLTYGLCRSYFAKRPFTYATAFQTLAFWIILLFFYFEPNWNKVHLLWIMPVIFFLVSFLIISRARVYRVATGEEIAENLNKNVLKENGS